MKDHWVRRFYRLAREVSTWSKDPGTKVGAVIVDPDRRILSTGYNGLPRGMADVPSRLANREFKLRHTIHAELNAILNASRSGVRLEGSSIYVWGLPTCPDCAKAIAQAGIARVFFCSPVDRPEWREAFEHSEALYEEAGIEVVERSAGWVDRS